MPPVVEGMAALALASSHSHRRGRVTSESVLACRNEFNVVGIHTQLVAATVVRGESLGDRTNQILPYHAVRSVVATFELDFAVASTLHRTNPPPTVTAEVDPRSGTLPEFGRNFH